MSTQIMNKSTGTKSAKSEAPFPKGLEKAAEPTKPWFSGKGMEMGEQGLYHLPKDHAWHSGPTYFCNDFQEWHYFTFLGTDKKTGHAITLFWCGFWQGWSKTLNRPGLMTVFAWHDTVTGEFINTTSSPVSKFETNGNGEPNFGFKYSIKDPDGVGFATTYEHVQEKWTFKSFAPEKGKFIGTPYSMDVTGYVKEPGYIPQAYWGFESIGIDKLRRQNPETMFGMSYYHTAPEMEMKGKVTLADGEHEIEGVAWFEHQWGNFRNTECSRYFWGYARFDNGDAITWRQYYGNPVGKLAMEIPFDKETAIKAWHDPRPEVNRFAFIPKGNPAEYAFGPTFLFTPIKWWTSPESGLEYPWWGEMKTPKGIFYLSPTFPAQESVTPVGSFIEGALLLREDSIDGPVVAHGFCELVQLPALGNPLTRELPERPVLAFHGGLKLK
ncbi:MAG: hypothetical protein JWR19_1653 [Pedosphaera sp.]|nr:hypothetical protein [Pedosphaera sp.]